jgi:hypothetical protein
LLKICNNSHFVTPTLPWLVQAQIDSESMALELKKGHKNGWRRHFKNVERFARKFCSSEK